MFLSSRRKLARGSQRKTFSIMPKNHFNSDARYLALVKRNPRQLQVINNLL